MAVPADVETNDQFQWYAARTLHHLHVKHDSLGKAFRWEMLSKPQKEAWRIIALLGIYSGWSAL